MAIGSLCCCYFVVAGWPGVVVSPAAGLWSHHCLVCPEPVSQTNTNNIGLDIERDRSAAAGEVAAKAVEVDV